MDENNLDPEKVAQTNEALGRASEAVDNFSKKINNTADISIDEASKQIEALSRTVYNAEKKLKSFDAYKKSADEDEKRSKKAEEYARQLLLEQMQDQRKVEDKRTQLYNDQLKSMGYIQVGTEMLIDTNTKLNFEQRRQIRNVKDSADAQQKQQEALDNLDKTMKDMVVNLGAGMGKMLLSVGKGDTSFNALTPIIDIVSGALAGMAEAIPFAGKAIAAGVKASAEASKFVLDQLGKVLKSFQDLSSVGGLTADGMKGLQNQYLESGLSMDGYVKAVKANATMLSTLGGTVGAGAEKFATVVGAMTNTGSRYGKQYNYLGDQLRNLGMSADDIAEGTALFLKREMTLGRIKGKSDQELIQGSQAYILELDKMTRITGLNRADIEKQREALLKDVRYRSYYEQQVAKGNGENAQKVSDFKTALEKIGDPELTNAFVASLSDMKYSNKDYQKYMLTFGPNLFETITKGLETGKFKDVGEALEYLETRAKNLDQAQKDNIAMFGNINKETGGRNPLAEYSTVLGIQNGNLRADVKEAAKSQDKLGKATDDQTKQATQAAKNMESISRRINEFAMNALPGASKAVNTFTSSLDSFLDWVENTTGSKIKRAPVPSGGGSSGGGGYGSGGGGGATPTGTKGILDLIGKVESGGDYNKLVGGKTADLTNMTIAQVMEFQKGMHKGNGFESSAVGKYQVISGTLRSVLKEAGVSEADKFDAATQDKIAVALLKRRGLNSYLQGGMTKEQFMDNIAKEWAGLPSSSGKSHYAGVGSNKHGTSRDEVSGALSTVSLASGGLVSGPTSGYPAMLHGKELVLPMPDASSLDSLQSITKQSLEHVTGGMTSNKSSAAAGTEMRVLIDILGEKMDTMIEYLRKSNSTQDKILSHARN